MYSIEQQMMAVALGAILAGVFLLLLLGVLIVFSKLKGWDKETVVPHERGGPLPSSLSKEKT